MGLIREPLDVDFYVGHRRVTQKELDEISAYIRSQKLRAAVPAECAGIAYRVAVPRKKMELA